MKISKNIHLIKCPLREAFTGVYVILGEKIVLIDSGLPDSWNASILPYLKRVDRNPKDIALVIHTHSHGDHIGSDAIIKSESNAEIAMHELDAQAVEDPKSWLKNFRERFGHTISKELLKRLSESYMEPLNVERHLKEGDVLDLKALKLRVIHTPGHSKGSICLYDDASRILFSGDSIQARGTILSDINLVFDVDDYLSSMKRLRDMEIEAILPAHHYKPLNKVVLTKNEGKMFILESIDNVRKMHNRILEVLQLSRSPLSTMQITEIICKEFGTGFAPPSPLTQAQFTIVSHLEKLVAENKIGAVKKNGQLLWMQKIK